MNVPYLSSYNSRNSTNNADLTLIFANTVNTIPNVLTVGSGTAGIVGTARTLNAAPTTSDLAAGEWAVWRNTAAATTKVYYNNGGAIIASAAFA